MLLMLPVLQYVIMWCGLEDNDNVVLVYPRSFLQSNPQA